MSSLHSLRRCCSGGGQVEGHDSDHGSERWQTEWVCPMDAMNSCISAQGLTLPNSKEKKGEAPGEYKKDRRSWEEIWRFLPREKAGEAAILRYKDEVGGWYDSAAAPCIARVFVYRPQLLLPLAL